MAVLSTASRKGKTEEQGCNLVPLSPHHTRSFQLMSAPAEQAKTAVGACRPSGTARPRPGRWQQELTCDAEIRDTSCRPVRSDEETLAGAPRCNLMLTFLSLSTLEIALGDVLPVRAGKNIQTRISANSCGLQPKRGALALPSPDCWIREVGVEAMGSVTLRRRLAVAPAGGPGGSARVAEPRSCPILSSRSCSRRSRSMSSGFRAAPWREKPPRPTRLSGRMDSNSPGQKTHGCVFLEWSSILKTPPPPSSTAPRKGLILFLNYSCYCNPRL